MRNFLLPIVMILAVATATAQKNDDHAEKRMERVENMNPENIASIQAKKMTLALDLSNSQEAQVEDILLKATIKKKEAMKNWKERKDMSKEEKMELTEMRMDEQIAMKRAFKEILNDEQYVKFEKMKMRKGKKRADNRKQARQGRR